MSSGDFKYQTWGAMLPVAGAFAFLAAGGLVGDLVGGTDAAVYVGVAVGAALAAGFLYVFFRQMK